MNKCSCYYEQKVLLGWEDGNTPIYGNTYGVCNGTREQDRCSCCGDETKCDFYPEVKVKALNKRLQKRLAEYKKKIEENRMKEELEKEKVSSWVGREGSSVLRCNHCGWEHDFPIPRNYCPNCGYKMKDISYIEVKRS